MLRKLAFQVAKRLSDRIVVRRLNEWELKLRCRQTLKNMVATRINSGKAAELTSACF